MSLAHSPKIVTNGLVLALDAVNTQKSWKGRPVTNQFALPTPDGSNNVSFPLNGTGIFKRIYSGTYDGYSISLTDVVYRYDLGVSGCHYHGNNTTVNSGQKVTFSFDYYVSPDAANYPTLNYLANLEGAVSGYIADTTPTIKGVWKRASFTATASSTGSFNMLLYPGACSSSYLASSGFILYKNPQVEFDAPGNVASPFVATTRSNTQTLLDMTNQNTITTNGLNYAFNSNYFMYFDGTSLSDYLNLSQNIFNSSLANFTISAWINISGDGLILTNHLSGLSWESVWLSNTLFIVNGANDNITNRQQLSFTTPYNAWTNIVAVKDSGNMTVYHNGVQTATMAATVTMWNTSVTPAIGALKLNAGGISTAMSGYMSNLQIHNRALTATEIKQNFNALRGRYGV